MRHLRPEARALAMLPAAERIVHVEVDRWIGYTAAQGALARLAGLIAREPGRIRPQNLLLVGPTNNGKTMIAERFRRMHPQRISDDRSHELLPVVAFQMPPDPTIGRVLIELLAGTSTPITPATIDARLALAMRLLRTCETRMLIVDEFHNLLGAPARRQRELLNFVRYLGNTLRIPIVALGTREAWLAIRSDPQLENRFAPYSLPTWTEGAELGRLLASFETCLPLRECSELGGPAMRVQVLRRSEGTIGEIAALVTRAAVAALERGRERIDEAALDASGYLGPSVRRHSIERGLAR